MFANDALAAAKAAALQDLFPRALKRGRRRPRRRENTSPPVSETFPPSGAQGDPEGDGIEYIPETIDDVVEEGMGSSTGAMEDIAASMRRFAERGGERELEEGNGELGADAKAGERNGTEKRGGEKDEEDGANTDAGVEDDDEEGDAEVAGKVQNVSRKQKKEQQRNLISLLKSHAEDPSVVEAWDVTAADPFLLVHLKAWPSSVPVPSNWRLKRKYLQNKRGMEKRAFQLPAYIVDTGVGELRDAQLEADDKKSLKQKQREKMRAKTGRGVEIDHGRLHDAFFKFQTKPRLTPHGDVYYELRELEVDSRGFRPGFLSQQLRAALGVGERDPPPWLVNMQRYGPPPGYPGLRVPGVNAPIPDEGMFGYHVGGWGRPPVDEAGNPIYGDVFGQGLEFESRDARFDVDQADKGKLWGEWRDGDDGLVVRAGEGEDEGMTDAPEETAQEAVEDAGSTTSRVANPGAGVSEGDMRAGVPEGRLYKVLEQRKVGVADNALLGSSHVYDVNGESRQDGKRPREESEASAADDAALSGQALPASTAAAAAQAGQSSEAGRSSKRQKEFKF